MVVSSEGTHTDSGSALIETQRIADRVAFSLDELCYEYPEEVVPAGFTPAGWLREATYRGARAHWPAGIPERIKCQLDHELALIRELAYEPYFLTVYDLVRFARSRGILCQGRGSAANSAVCFCLGITAVDPTRSAMLMERFLSRERGEPPDIDVDFEHQRREEVIQYIYARYGTHRAALAATVVTYRRRSAIRDVGKALGLSQDQIERLAAELALEAPPERQREALQAAGCDPASPVLKRLVALAATLVGFPRHLSQHVGGFVIARDDLSRLVPVENAAMAGRTVIQWDKDDLAALGLIKVDVLGLGMLTALRRCFEGIEGYSGRRLSLTSIPAADPATYRMITRADTVGVFQIESRAQMSLLPRLRPTHFYDLVVAVALIRPGPIQGQMVHPYLQRRAHPETVSYPSPALRAVLGRTLGVPLFQEQVMELAMVAAGFSGGAADRLRHALANGKGDGSLEEFRPRLMEGMRANGYSEATAERLCAQIAGFGAYGFPESHAASFALLAYISAWLKRHEPAAFTCALVNAQPLGFYAPAQLLQDARRHGVVVRPVDVRYSDWEATLEPRGPKEQPAVRLGLARIKGLAEATARAIVAERPHGPFADVADLAARCGLSPAALEPLAAADALRGLAGDRHRAHWAVAGLAAPSPLLGQPDFTEATPLLKRPSAGQEIVADYNTTGATLRRHPVALQRPQLEARRDDRAADLGGLRPGQVVRVAGLVTHRQRPATAAGAVFVTLEDETGLINLVVRPQIAAAQRRPLQAATLLEAAGTLQRVPGVVQVVAGRLTDRSEWLAGLKVDSRDFR